MNLKHNRIVRVATATVVTLLFSLMAFGASSPAAADHSDNCSVGFQGRTASVTCHGPGVVGFTVECKYFGWPSWRYKVSTSRSIDSGYHATKLTCGWPTYPNRTWYTFSPD